MKKWQRTTISLLLCCSLLLSGCSGIIGWLTGKVQMLKALSGLRPTPVGIGLRVEPSNHFPKGFKSKYPLKQGEWSTDRPLFDPLGSEDKYAYLDKQYVSGDIEYIGEDYQATELDLAGDHWQMSIEDESPDTMLHLEKYIYDLGGRVISAQTPEVAFTIEQEPYVWWGKITPKSAIEIELYKERRLKVGETITITAEDRAKAPDAYGRVYFSTSRTQSDRLQSLTIRVNGAEDGDEVVLSAKGGYSLGGYKREAAYQKELIVGTNQTDVFTLDNIPQEPGDTRWYVQVDGGDQVTVSITLNEIAKLEPVAYGEDMGALLVKGVPFGTVSVPLTKADNHTNIKITHPDMITGGDDIYPNQTPEGDSLFWLPAGYWNLDIYSDVLQTTSHARGIPVSAGQLTVVQMASNINSIFSQTTDLKEGTTEHGMTFLQPPKEQGDQVELTFLLYDSNNKNAHPTKEATKIYENGEPVEVVSIERLDIPPSVVLLLDSSGSMAEQMKPAVDAAKEFVQGLPDNATVQVVDFDSTARRLQGTTKAEVLQSLDSVTTGGSTALYDAAMLGLDLLKGAQRPTLVMFTDGKNEPAAGGLTDKGVVVEAIKASGVPVYTIGFGKEHAPAEPAKTAADAEQKVDETKKVGGSDLIDFAEISEGKYYSAADPDALKGVFAAIAARLGNTFTARYQRPQLINVSDVPVVTVVLDRSGSMGEWIEGQGEKMQIAKDMFREFFMQMPDGIMTQLITFEDIWLEQVLTTDKATMLQAVSALEASGATNIVDSARLAYDTLRAVPTSNRILVFLTDAAMEDKGNETFAQLLEKIKNADIKSLWLGLGMEEESEMNFAWAAEASGGSYLLPNSAKELSDGLTKMLSEVKKQKTLDKTLIGMEISLPNEQGRLQSYAGNIEHKLSPLKSSGLTEAPPQAIRIMTNQPAEQLFASKPDTESGLQLQEVSANQGQKTEGTEQAELLYAGDLPSTDTQIISRVPLKAKGSSKGIEITAAEYARLGRLRGVKPPKDMEYLALKLQVKNLFNDRPFQIPDFTSHFYIGVNDLGLYPASMVTWLAETPLADPGENTVNIATGQTKTGILIFLVPTAQIQDLQLEFYDTVNGNIQLALLGAPKKRDIPLEKLPTTVPAKLSDTFTLTVKAYSDVDRIGQHKAPKDAVYRIVESEITSNVQALLDIAPTERFFMNIDSGRGTVRLPISAVTSYIPQGYLQPKLLAPGSATPIRWVFAVPKVLAGAKAEIFGDLADGAIHIPVKSGSAPSSSAPKGTFKGEWADVTVNEIGLLTDEDLYTLWYPERMMDQLETEEAEAARKEPAQEEPEQEDSDQEEEIEEEQPEEEYTEEQEEEEYSEGRVYALVDLTITDKIDGFGTTNIPDMFRFVSNRVKEGSSPGQYIVDGEEQVGLGNFSADELFIPHDGITERLVLGINDSWGVLDGESRRGLMIFELRDRQFNLQSQYFKGLNLPPQNSAYSNKKLLIQDMAKTSDDQEFALEAAAQIEKVIRQYEAKQSLTAQKGEQKPGVITLVETAGKNTVPFPSVNGAGAKKLTEPQTIDQALTLMRTLAWRPSYQYGLNEWITNLSPQAVLTQGWGNEFDLIVLAEQLFSQLGVKTNRMVVTITDKGEEEIAKYLKLQDEQIEQMKMTYLPALAYRDANGKHQLFVIPFMQHLTQLDGLAYLPEDQPDKIEMKSKTATVSVTVKAIPLGEAAAGAGGMLGSGGLFGSMSDAMGGAEESQPDQTTLDIEVLSQQLEMEALSSDAVDIGFGVAQGEAYVAFMEAPAPIGRVMGQTVLQKKYYQPVSARITVSVDGEDYLHDIPLKKNEALDGIFTTVAINLPELPKAALKDLNKAVEVGHKNAKAPNEISALRWYTRNNLYRFIGAQTAYEDQLAADLKLTVGRTTKPRCIAVTVRKQEKDNKINTSIDLISVVNQIHNGSKEATNAFHIMSGLTASRMEGLALGKQGYDFSTIWKKAPKEAGTIVLSSSNVAVNIPILREAGFPEKLIQNMENASNGHEKVFIFNNMPSKINGEERWAWLEIDGETCETIAVLDTGERGGFAEYTLLDVLKTPEGSSYVQYMMGAMVGVDVGLWSMCAANLVTNDYKEAVKLAAEYASGVSEYVHVFFDMLNALKSAQALSPGGMDWKIKTSSSSPTMAPGSGGGEPWRLSRAGKDYLQLEVDIPIPGLVDGFDAGLQYYFDNL